MQVAAKNMPVGSLVVGVDLVPIRPIRGALSLQEDITTSKCRANLKKLLKAKGYSVVDVVLHDGSPNVGGAWTKEASSQASLVLDSLRLATDFLAPGGTFVTKVCLQFDCAHSVKGYPCGQIDKRCLLVTGFSFSRLQRASLCLQAGRRDILWVFSGLEAMARLIC